MLNNQLRLIFNALIIIILFGSLSVGSDQAYSLFSFDPDHHPPYPNLFFSFSCVFFGPFNDREVDPISPVKPFGVDNEFTRVVRRRQVAHGRALFQPKWIISPMQSDSGSPVPGPSP